jgi:hypothetical protein
MQRGLSLTVLVVAVGAAIGAGWLIDHAKRDAAAPATPAPVEDGASKVVLPSDTVPTSTTPGTPPDAADLLAKQLGEKIDAATQTSVRERAAAMRRRLVDAAAVAESTAAYQMAEEIRKERAERADRMRGGTMAFLKGLERSWAPQVELVRSPERFGALFARQTDAGVVDGATLSYASRPPDGTTIRFAAGQFALDVRAMNSWRPFPKDLAVQGAGMDATLLVTNSDLDVRESVVSLTFRDLTIHTNDEYLDRLRNAPYTIRMDRCRVIGFDMGAGQSSMLGGSIGAFYARDCRFEAGFGRSLGSGVLFDVRGALLARLENCDIVGPLRSAFIPKGCATQVFTNCRFTNIGPRDAERVDGAAEFTGCTFQVLTADNEKAARTRRSVAEFNPAWKDPKR